MYQRKEILLSPHMKISGNSVVLYKKLCKNVILTFTDKNTFQSFASFMFFFF